MKQHHCRRIARLFCAAFLLCSLGASLHAQTCAAPMPLFMPNQTVSIDTCSSGYNPGQICANGIATTGPAVVFSLTIPYPAPNYTIIATPAADFDVGFGLESQTCSALALCPGAVDEGGAGFTESMNLGNVDSGRYFLVVTSFNFSNPHNCGPVTVTLFSSDDNPPDGDGVVRHSFDY